MKGEEMERNPWFNNKRSTDGEFKLTERGC
jgi:hypothetical protein